MSTTVVTKVVSYQVGVDILGFPVYHEHPIYRRTHHQQQHQKARQKYDQAPPHTHRRTPYIRLHRKTILTTPHTNTKRAQSEHVKQF